MATTFDGDRFSTASKALIVAGAAIGGTLGIVTIGFPAAIATTILGAFCGVILADSLG